MNVNSTNPSTQADTQKRTKVIAGTAAGATALALGTLIALRAGKGAQAADSFQKAAPETTEKAQGQVAAAVEGVKEKAAAAAEEVKEKVAGAAEEVKEKVAKPLGEKIKGAFTKIGAFFKKAGKVIALPFKKAWQGIKFVAEKLSGLFHKKGAAATEATQGAAEAAVEKVAEAVGQ